MPRAKPAPEPPKRASGPTQAEDARKARQVLLRLLPSAERELRRRARESGLSMSAVVSALLLSTSS